MINKLHSLAKQVWYADDAAACSFLNQLRTWWDSLSNVGPTFGYFVNAAKTYLAVKPTLLSEEEALFEGSSVRVTDQGHCYLGTVIGQSSFVEKFVTDKFEG